MKLLLTGEPHAGKSTLLNTLLQRIDRKQGFITVEVTKGGQRTGFELVACDNRKALLADVSSASNLRVSRYGVNLDSLDKFIDGLPQIDEHTLLYIDEIGQMQLHSDKFIKLVNQYIESDNDFVGTISKVYKHDLIRKLKSRNDIEIIEVTPANRDQLEGTILAKLQDRHR